MDCNGLNGVAKAREGTTGVPPPLSPLPLRARRASVCPCPSLELGLYVQQCGHAVGAGVL